MRILTVFVYAIALSGCAFSGDRGPTKIASDVGMWSMKPKYKVLSCVAQVTNGKIKGEIVTYSGNNIYKIESIDQKDSHYLTKISYLGPELVEQEQNNIIKTCLLEN